MSATLMQAVQALQRGQFKDAIRHSRAHLARSPDDFHGHHLLGIALCEDGDLEAGRAAVERAAALDPTNPEPYYNLGGVLLAHQDLAGAEQCYRRALQLRPDHASAWNNLGSLLTQQERHDEAREAYRRVLHLQPRHAAAYRNLANLQLAAGELADAEACYRKSLALEPDNLTSLLGLGGALFTQGRASEARQLLEQALRRQPDHPELLGVLGGMLLQGGSYEEAERALRRAVEIDPALVDARDNLGVALGNLGRIDEARECYQAVLEAQPDHIRARANLAKLLEMSHQTDAAREVAMAGLARQPDYAALQVVIARCDRREGELEQAARRLEDLLERAGDRNAPKEVHFELGTIYDRLERYDEAFDQFSLGNQRAAEWWRHIGGSADTFMDGLGVLRQRYDRDWVASWTAAAAPAPRTPVFLLGFQRSGTTLLDAILDSHTQLQVMEEAPALLALVDRLARGAGYPDALAGLAPSDIAALRALYDRQVDQALQRQPETRLVDKMPLNTAHLGLIQRVFPGAPIILAVRHPLDVCLSCFMQDFDLNSFMSNFQSLEGVARVYAEVMELASCYQQLLPLNLLPVRYEDLVADFNGQVQRILTFLDLPWEQGLTDFATRARGRLINTPSYHQVSQPIYQRASHRWRHYERHLAPIREPLQPFIERFGYNAP